MIKVPASLSALPPGTRPHKSSSRRTFPAAFFAFRAFFAYFVFCGAAATLTPRQNLQHCFKKNVHTIIFKIFFFNTKFNTFFNNKSKKIGKNIKTRVRMKKESKSSDVHSRFCTKFNMKSVDKQEQVQKVCPNAQCTRVFSCPLSVLFIFLFRKLHPYCRSERDIASKHVAQLRAISSAQVALGIIISLVALSHGSLFSVPFTSCCIIPCARVACRVSRPRNGALVTDTYTGGDIYAMWMVVLLQFASVSD